MASPIQLFDLNGEQRFTGTSVGGGGAQPLVDLGVVHATDLLSGPVTLHNPAAGEYVSVAFGAVVAGDTGQGIQIGLGSPTDAAGFTRQLFAWLQMNGPIDFTNLKPELYNGSVFDGTQPIRALCEVETNGYAILSTPAAWQGNHAYPASVVLIHGPDAHFWSQSAGGTSGGTIPDFAGNEGGSVVDNGVTWTDEGPVPTTGSIHLYALVAST